MKPALATFCLFALLASRDGEPWETVRVEADGLTVESRAVEGSDLPELRITAKAPPAPRKLLESAWVLGDDPYLAERRVLAQSPGFRLLYLRYEPPIIAPRECVLEQQRSVDPETGAAHLKFDRLKLAAEGGAAALPFAHLRGSWRFEPVSGGTRVVYTVLIDVGGVPAFLARGPQADAAVDVVRGVIERAAR